MGIQLSDEAVSKLIEQSLVGNGSTFGASIFVGKPVFIRTVTFHYVGILVRENASWLVLEDAAWVADSGRWADALKTGKLNEVEPFPDGEIEISRDTVVDVSAWLHSIPRDQK